MRWTISLALDVLIELPALCVDQLVLAIDPDVVGVPDLSHPPAPSIVSGDELLPALFVGAAVSGMVEA